MKSTSRSRFLHDPDGQRLPIKLDNTTNGEYLPAGLEAGPLSRSV